MLFTKGENQNDLSHVYGQLRWREKIHFMDELIKRIQERNLAFGQKCIESSWTYFLKENNLNIVKKVIECLRLYVLSHEVKSAKIRRQIIESLLVMSKMNLSEIDEMIIEIVCILIKKQKENHKANENTATNKMEDQTFSSLNHPTFLTGHFCQHQTNYEMETQISMQNQHRIETNGIRALIQIVQRCRKYEFNISLQIVCRIISQNDLNVQQILELYATFKNIREVLSGRRQLKQENIFDIQISINYQKFSQMVLTNTQ